MHYTRTRVQVTTRTTDGTKIDESILVTTELTLVVNEVTGDRTAQITALIDRIQYRKKSTGADEVHYDSNTDAAPTGVEGRWATNLKELLGSQFSFEMTARGEIRDIRVTGRTTGKLAGAAPKSASPFAAKGIKNLLPFLLLPEEAVDSGKSWQEQTDYLEPLLGLRKVDLAYRYVRPEVNSGRQAEKIAFTADVRFVALPRTKLTADVRRNECSGTIYFDKGAGRLVAKESREKLSLVLLEDGRRIEQDVQATVTMKLLP